jgi:hypothetical protein
MQSVHFNILRAAHRGALTVPVAVLTLAATGPTLRASEPVQSSGTYQVTSLSPSSASQRIGFLSTGSTEPLLEDFRQGLRELGYVEGQNVGIR